MVVKFEDTILFFILRTSFNKHLQFSYYYILFVEWE